MMYVNRYDKLAVKSSAMFPDLEKNIQCVHQALNSALRTYVNISGLFY